MSTPFKPADGQQARWRYAYDLVVSKKPDDDITLMELAEKLGIDFDPDRDTSLLRAVMLEAKKHLEQAKQQTVRTVEKYGWVVIDAKGNLDEIERRRKKASRATNRTARLIVATDRSALSSTERNRLDFETRNVLTARSLFGRKTKSFAELERESRRHNVTELPFRQQDSA